ncbi:hypothetical protein [Streptomyces sp. E-08]|uniref:hypothetical protein n=1 Tax=Streptomyces sp. E-08 TaxID=3404047 RepID=UPI003CF78C5F
MPVASRDSGTEAVRTVCSYCGVGCGIVLDIARDPATGLRRAAKASGDKSHPTNFGRLCTKGSTSADMLAAPGRATAALVRGAGRRGSRDRRRRRRHRGREAAARDPGRARS